jgi:hypothetical protein
MNKKVITTLTIGLITLNILSFTMQNTKANTYQSNKTTQSLQSTRTIQLQQITTKQYRSYKLFYAQDEQVVYVQLQNINDSKDMYYMATNLTEQQMKNNKIHNKFMKRIYLIQLDKNNEPVKVDIQE